MNDSLMTQRKSLQKAREGLQKELSKVLKDKENSEMKFKKQAQEIEK